MTGAIPGAELGTAGQVIPKPVRPVPAPRVAPQTAAPTKLTPDDPAASRVLENRIAEKFIENSSREMVAQTRELRSDVEQMPTSVRDKTAVLSLLENPPTRAKGKKVSDKYYAHAYFKNHPDVGSALHAIVSDFAAIGESSVPKFRNADSILAGEGAITPQMKVDLEYYKDTGTEPAKRAVAWVRKNLSPETIAAMRDIEAMHRPRDYATTSANADVRKTTMAKQLDAERAYRESITETGESPYDADMAEDLGLSQENLSDLDDTLANFRSKSTNGAPLHPRVLEYLRAGDVVGALRNIKATATNKYDAKLAGKLSTAISGTKVQIVPESVMAQVESVMRPARTPDQRGAAMGVFIPNMTPEAIEDAQRQGRDEAVGMAQLYGGSILINESSGLDVTTVLHEASHAAMDRITRNPSHPLTRQLTVLMDKIAPQTEPGFNGSENLQEFIAEGLTNPEFRREMSLLNPDGDKFSAWEMFTNRIKNFLRRLMGMESKPLGSMTDAIDFALDAVIATSPEDRGAGDIMASSFRPLGARKVLNDFSSRVKTITPADSAVLKGHLRDLRMPTKYKAGIMWLSMPLDYIGDAAKPFFPKNARVIPELVNEHKAAKSRILDVVTESLAFVNEWVKNNLNLIDTFNDVRFMATRFGADPRKNRSEYVGFSYKYDEIDPVSGDARTVESSRYKTRDDLNAAMDQHNRIGIPGNSEASVGFQENADQLAAFDEVMRGYQSLGPLGRKAMDTIFAIPEVLTKNLARALKTRLEALLPTNRALQEKIYGKIYDKVFGGNGVTPYQTLSRTGDYALSYYGADPKKVDVDENGKRIGPEPDVQYWTHSFQSSRERNLAIRFLQSQPAAYAIDLSSITPYQQNDRNKRSQMPLEMSSRILAEIEGSSLDKSVRDAVLEMILDTAPETSFMQMFRVRKGTRGFIGDISPLEQGLTPGDTISNIRDNSLRIASNIVDLEFGARFSKAKLDLSEEYKAFGSSSKKDPVERGRDVEEARALYDALVSYTTSSFNRQGTVSQTLTTGAWALTLAANISSALLVLATLPVYAFTEMGPIHGAKATMQAFGIAIRMITGSGRYIDAERITSQGQIESFRKKGRFFEFGTDHLDLSDPASKFGYMKAFQEAGRINGLFGRSLSQDLTAGEDMVGPFAPFKKLLAASGVMQSTLERVTREITGVSKYHLALQKIAKAENKGDFSIKQLTKKLQDGSLTFSDSQYSSAAKEAMVTAEKTNGPMFAAAGPQASQSDIGKILYLYKRHSLAMYNLLYQKLMRSLPNKAELAAMSKEDRAVAKEDIRIARMQLGGMMGALSLTSGALGLPLVQQIGWLYDALADDDEEDFKTMTRMALGEQGAYGMLDYITGVRVSERIGLGEPFYRAGLNSQDQPPLWRLIEGLGGPVIGISNKYATRVLDLFSEGEIWRGTEAALPSSIANVFRAARYSQEGVRTLRGDPIIDDISPASILAQAVGFMPAAYSRQLDINSALSRVDNAIKNKRSQLLSRRYQAATSGDRLSVREIDREIAEFNIKYRGKAEITEKTKEASMRANMKTTSRMHHGVNLSEMNIKRIMEMANDYGPATIWE